MPNSPSEFDDLLKQAQDPVLGHLIRLTGSLHAAQDLLQSANVTAISKSNSFTVGTNFVAWLRQIAINHFRNHVRKGSASRRVALVDDDLYELVERRHRMRIQQEQQNHDWYRVMQCLQQLPNHQREVITQFYLHGQTMLQISELTGRSPNAVGQTLYRARLAIVKCVKRLPDEAPIAEAVQNAESVTSRQANQ